MTSLTTQSSQPTTYQRVSQNALRQKLRRVGAPISTKTFATVSEPMEPLHLPEPMLPIPPSTDALNFPVPVFEQRSLTTILELPEEEIEQVAYQLWGDCNVNIIHHSNLTETSVITTSSLYHSSTAVCDTPLTSASRPSARGLDGEGSQQFIVWDEIQWVPVTELVEEELALTANNQRQRWNKRVSKFISRIRKLFGARRPL
ncbi:hypothetical protein CVT24_005540 [Panaeolus cyanescens]|uniref:Uncharacterized protein n=1 Tax=Panaeolus cyanescens TaxID=181874 RepID=A0A409VQH5_9AGAR|nr:hypothetical protein CVT24_005540 [Panaeolus cyanescens]